MDELGGSALRLLHQLASSPAAAEALARIAPPAVPTILAAIRYDMMRILNVRPQSSR